MYVEPSTTQNLGNTRWVIKYARPDLGRLVVAFFLWVIDKCLIMVLPIIAGLIIDQVVSQHQYDRLGPYLTLFIVVPIVRSAVKYAYQMLCERFGQNSLYRLVSDEYEKLHTLDFTYFNHTRNGDIMSRLTQDTDYIRHTLSWDTYQIADCFALVLGSLAIMFTIDWRLAVALLVVTPFIFFITRSLARRARPIYLTIRNSLADMNSMVEENIEGNRLVKAFVREDYEIEKFDAQNADYYDKNIDAALNSRRYLPWLDACSWVLQILTLFLGGFLIIQGNMTIGNLVTFSSYLWMLTGPLGMSGWLIMDIERFNASCVKIRRLLGANSHISEQPDAHATLAIAKTVALKVQEEQGDAGIASPDVVATTDLNKPETSERISGEITFNHVSFSFPDDPKTPVLKNIDFHIPAGSKLGILGETGSGKSTLVSLIARFYDPSLGHVLIDGIDARDWPLATLRSQVLIVAQDTFLFSDTIGENIAFGAENRDEDYIQRMAYIAGASGFIEHLPEGYDTIVGERGVGLSGGQKQRLSLARALADDPSILIMDDTTSAVDMETEAEIQEHLQELGHSKTIITIAHRISSVKDSDLILFLEHGQIVERGTHQQLVEAHGRYFEIYQKQLGLQSGEAVGF